MSYKNSLSAQQRRAAEILATNDLHKMRMEDIAKEVGVNERTIYRWKKDPAFVEYQNEIAEHVMNDFLTETYNVLRTIVRSGRSDNAKLKAIELVLKNRGKLTDVAKVEARVEDTRSNEAIQNEIDELKRLLGELDE
ncbi:phBC6A51 family helix-turn-helix protein [Fredinandcohnia humi]